MAILKTSQEINKSWGTYRNKFYPGRKMTADPVIVGGKTMWCCQIAVKQHDDGLKCPHCGGNPGDDWYDHIEYNGYDGERHLNTQPYIVGEGSCEKCGKYWVVTDNVSKDGAVIRFELPRTAHTFDCDDPYWKDKFRK